MFTTFLVHLVSTVGDFRPVDVPTARVIEARRFGIATLLDLIFTFGRNDFQPKQFCSVSVNDVVLIPVPNGDGDRTIATRYYRIDFAGFTPMTISEYRRHAERITAERERREVEYAARMAGKDIG